jgi:type I site-specific restriction-modification system R (restriction) subunit
MDLENKDNANEQGAAQPDASTAAAEQSAPTKSAAEEKLEGQLAAAKTKGDGYKKERDTARAELKKVSEERDALRTENEQLKAQPTTVATSEAAATAPTEEPSEEEHIKDVLRRNGLKVAYMLPDGPCFSEAHAKHVAGADFDSLTTISAE